MRNVPWPQNRFKPTDHLFKLEPLRDHHYIGVADDIGQVWPEYSQSMEVGYNEEVYLIGLIALVLCAGLSIGLIIGSIFVALFHHIK